MRDNLASGRSILTFNVIDDYNHEGLGIGVDHSLSSASIIIALEATIDLHSIRLDNGPKYASKPFIN